MSLHASLGPSAVELISGSLGGIAATAIFHPLELVKTRLQVDRRAKIQFGKSVQIARHVVLCEGGIQGLYRGLISNLVGNASSWAVYFVLYGDLKARIRRMRGRGRDSELSFFEYFSASAVSGFFSAAFTNPVWVVKTRMLSTASSNRGSYSSLTQGFYHIYTQDGIRGFYRGFIPSLYGILHGALQFMIYERLKIIQSRRRYGDARQSLYTADYLWMSAVSKTISGIVTYPYQVVRARLQMHGAEEAYRSSRDVVAQVWRQEGPLGFYKGLGPNLLRVVPTTCVTFVVYESIKNSLSA